MKSNMKFILFAASMLSAIGFTACDENATIDVPGPDVDFTFNYGDIANAAAPAQRGISVWLTKVSETVPGEDVVGFLEKDSTNKKYADAIVAATLKNGKLTVTGGTGNFNFAGVDSVKITYKITGSSVVYDLVVGAPDAANLAVVNFNDIKITKDQALEMMQSEKVVTMLVKINVLMPEPNCFKEGAVYSFTANSLLSVKASSVTSGLFGTEGF
jgi:hypothetical protein